MCIKKPFFLRRRFVIYKKIDAFRLYITDCFLGNVAESKDA